MSTTHVLMVVDGSGSMEEHATEVRSGFNTYVDFLRDTALDKGLEFNVTLVVFNTEAVMLCEDAALIDVPELTRINYRPSGMTALLDAVGMTLDRFSQNPKNTRGDKVILFIQTDGLENASNEYGWPEIRRRLDRHSREGWSIVYAGKGVDAWNQRGQFGPGTQTVHTNSVERTYSGFSAATVEYAETGDPSKAGQTVAQAQEDPA